MQETSSWKAPTGALGRLNAKAYERAECLRPLLEELRAQALDLAPAPSFMDALRRAQGVAVIAEVKRRSPSRGTLNASIDVAQRAREYEAGGASALSILTEPTEFGGDLGDLREARAAITLPLLRKDFLVDESQILEARVAGASSVLLIARALEPIHLEALFGFARAVGLEPLVEVRSEAELQDAIRVGASVIGVNARNLETLVIDSAVVGELLPQIPSSCVAVAESGVETTSDVERAARWGADAVLVGSALSRAEDASGAVHALASVTRRGRGA